VASFFIGYALTKIQLAQLEAMNAELPVPVPMPGASGEGVISSELGNLLI
jgi:hypothetical protein